jgi:hypothetical protein
MTKIAKILGPLALVLTILPPLLFLGKAMSEPNMKIAMLAGTILWFATAPWFLKGGES